MKDALLLIMPVISVLVVIFAIGMFAVCEMRFRRFRKLGVEYRLAVRMASRR